MKNKISKIQVIRRITQAICFVFASGLFAEAFMGLKTIIEAITGSIAPTISAIFPVLLLILSTVLFGRIFCGWLCAFGALGDFFYALGKRVFRIKFKMPKKADGVLKYLKYIILLALVFTWVAEITLPEGFSPWDAFGELNSLPPALGYTLSHFLPGTVLLVLILIASMFVERFFCRYLCPMGAVFSIFSKLKVLNIKKPRTDCGKCRICTRSCAMGIALYEKDSVSAGECIGCMQCIEACPRKNVRLSVQSRDLSPLLAAVAAFSVIGVYSSANIRISQPGEGIEVLNNGDLTTVSPKAVPSAGVTPSATPKTSKTGYSDGTYQGSGIGYHGQTITLSVTVSGGKIVSITTVSSRDTARYYNRAFSSLIPEIIADQGTSVDAVSGATYSSRGIISAVSDALMDAQG